jgi:predicted phosphodiesterase
MIPTLRVIGDVHGQIDADSLFTRDARTYLEIIADGAYSVQLGDMGNGETYDQLMASVDAGRHRFFPGNHENYDRLPPHSLGDFGCANLGGVEFFFIRGANSTDREKLIRIGEEEGKTLWFEQEELTAAQMRAAEEEYLRVRPRIVITHDGPTHVARFAWQHARSLSPPNPRALFRASRTTDFLERLLEQHQPRLWLFGHHHRDCRRKEGETLFVCVGELSSVDITATCAVS